MPNITEAGDYEVTISNAEFGESSNGTPFVTFKGTTSEGDSIQAWIYLSEKSLPHAIKTLRDAFEFDGNFETLIEQIDGKQAKFVVVIEEYEGKERAKVQFVNSINGGYKAKPLANAPAFLKSLTERAKKIPLAAGQAPTKTPTQTKRTGTGNPF